MSAANPSGHDIRPRQQTLPANGPLMAHENRSVPSLSPTGPTSPPPPLPPAYDPSLAFDQLRISDQHPMDPIPRSQSSMSMRSYQYHHPHQQQFAHIPEYDNFDQASRVSYGSDILDSYYAPPPQQHQQQWAPPPPPQQYDPLYSAASSVLGMAPPPPPQQQHQQPYDHIQYTQSQSSFSSSSHSIPPPQFNPAASTSSFPPPQMALQPPPDGDFEMRPPLPGRTQTSSSLHPSTIKSKAVDLSTPPYTKEYIDSYRQRIKSDPDPEAHFLYAKYLVDAARKIRDNANKTPNERNAKKYSEYLIQEALKVFRRLATQGDPYPEAQFYLAGCYGSGALGLQVDHERAYHLYLQASKSNHAAASYRVAVCNEIGAGTRRDPARAAAFYRKAASLGDTAAMYKLGMILLNGLLGEAKNGREAVGWLKRAAEQADEENPHALHELGLLYQTGAGGLVPQDGLYAKQLFTQAAHLNYPPAQLLLGQAYEYGSQLLGIPINPKQSIAWYTRAAALGSPEAELALSGWYLTGAEGVLKQSDSEAYLWARRAANKGLSKAEYAVGYYAEVGIGVKQDVEFARRWYLRAAAQGNKRAMNRLTEMKKAGNKRPAPGALERPTRQQAKDECVIM